jgi:ATP-dependent Clp protease protease subunit
MGKKQQDQSPAKEPEKAAAKPAPRRVYLFGRLENEVTLPTIKKLLRLNDQDPSTAIDLYINSAGGNGYNADAIISVIHSIQAKVNTICLGHALSGACEILASGTGERSSYEFATLMFHQTLWEADGDITNLEIQAAQGQRFRNAQIEMLSRCTGQDSNTVRKDIERDHYMSAEEALSYGIIDKIVYHTAKRTGGKNSDNRSTKPGGRLTESAQQAIAGKTGKSEASRKRSARKASSRRG